MPEHDEDRNGLADMVRAALGRERTNPSDVGSVSEVKPAEELIEETETKDSDAPDAGERRQRDSRTAEQLAAMIESDLSSHPDCPKVGIKITVYGATQWRAMLTITPAAGPVQNARELRELTEELAIRLRNRFDLVWD